MPKVIVARYDQGPEPIVVYGPFNDDQAARKAEEWREENAMLDPAVQTSYTVCDLR